MWLIDVQSYKLRYFQDASQVAQKYAILSHRWEDEEVSHSDMTGRWDRLRLKRMKGWYKIQKCCEQAIKDDLSYAWVDTCCIDKTSSAELQEAINSMFTWYSEARTCYVFLSDVKGPSGGTVENSLKISSVLDSFRKSQWFTRGWTLQELLAPKSLTFYDYEWRAIALRSQHTAIISEITGIEPECLNGFDPSWTLNTNICVAQVMTWASGRKTTRIEDKAYSLLGIFGVSMPMLYGEGRRAFTRLQEELLRSRDDQSIFAWVAPEGHKSMAIALTDSPDDFVRLPKSYRWVPPTELGRRKPHIVSSDGISVELLMLPVRPGLYHAFLNTGMVNVDLQDLVISKGDNDSIGDGIICFKIIAFPVKEIGPDQHFIRMVPEKARDLIYYEASQIRECVLRRVTLSNFLKRQEYEDAMEEDSASFMIPNTVSDLWSFSSVHDHIEPPQTWPWPSSETRVVKGEKPRSAAGLLTWNGWPQRLFWGYDILPLSAVAFGYDFDFNPTCVVIAGRISYAGEGFQRLQQGFRLDIKDGEKEFKIDEERKFNVEGGVCRVVHFQKDATSALIRHDEHRDPPVMLVLKTVPSTRRSGQGFHGVIYLDNSPYDHYYRAKLHIKVSRESKKVPWKIELSIEKAEMKVVTKSVAPRLRRFVQPRPAYRLGTWAEHETRENHAGSSSTSVQSD